MRDHLFRVQAIILKRSDFGEADRILTLLTADQGKLRAIAKGARKPLSRKSGHIELFTHSQLLLAKGRNLDIVTQADTLDAFGAMRANLERVGYAYYLAELVDKFAEEGTENHALFDLLLQTMRRLGDETNDPVLLARYFEMRLLHLVGYQPQLYHCVHCGVDIEPMENYFSAEAGGILDPICVQTERERIVERGRGIQSISLNALKVLRYLQTREFESIRSLHLGAEVQAEVEDLIHTYIAHHLERNLKSVEFLHQLKQPLALQALPARATVR